MKDWVTDGSYDEHRGPHLSGAGWTAISGGIVISLSENLRYVEDFT